MKFTSLLTVILFFLLSDFHSFSQIEQNTFISGKCTGANSLTPTTGTPTSATVGVGRVIFLSTPFTIRTYLEFDVSSIPEEAIITSATLKLYRETATGSPVIYTARITEAWDENVLSWSNQPDYETADQITTTNFDIFGWMNVNVTSHVQKMVADVYDNNGWMLYHNNETENANKYYTFRSDDYADPAYHPRLQVSYYIPMSVTDAVITHESAAGASDGAISPVLANGPGGTYTYQWYNSAGLMPGKTALNLTGVPYGWYGLRVTSSIAGTEPFYYAFLVGENCTEREIEFNPGPDFIDDAVLRNNPSNTDQFTNFHNTAVINMAYGLGETHRSVLKFRLWLDEALRLNEATLSLMVRNVQYNLLSPNNSGRMYLIETYWSERLITFSSQPNYSPSGFISIPTLTTAPQVSTFNALNSFEFWQQTNTENFGWIIRLNSETGRTSQNFHSSDTTVSRPKVNFKVGIYDSRCLSYSEMKRALDGGYSYAMDGKLKFTMDEAYELDASKFLPFTIYDKNHRVLESSDIDGVVLNGSVAPLPLKFDDNRWVLDISAIPGITTGEYYILEVSNSKGDKRYLRFFYKN